jgi:transposase-like protein
MKVMPKGDHYVWYCDWCDSKNLTIWTKVDTGKFSCAACQREFSIESDGHIHHTDTSDLLLLAV